MSASFGKFDTIDFDAFISEFENKIKGKQIATEVQDALTKTAGVVIRKVKQKTPVDQGTLRRNWQASGAKRHAGVFLIDIFNNIEYAPFIENGHRIVRGGRTVGYQSGIFMLRDSLREIDNNWENLVGKKFLKAIENLLED
ncbi:HK97 gp10 family phage protein [Leuconostoc gelidum subsp. gasicomitatum]|uniref:HK97 gp10 family phage protein n=1 Tax=Leuconostoc gasicomitatum TaxID=115778 RepID=UPI001CC5E83B|nr:HK97 gp10 family phage protein [Leuconostoc gasicomitatum]MBZ5952910.1 HK97 gp10 family phage protein [Leuconostoc gasicomitatum]